MCCRDSFFFCRCFCISDLPLRRNEESRTNAVYFFRGWLMPFPFFLSRVEFLCRLFFLSWTSILCTGLSKRYGKKKFLTFLSLCLSLRSLFMGNDLQVLWIIMSGSVHSLAFGFYGTAFYLTKTFFPLNVSPFYPMPDIISWTSPQFLRQRAIGRSHFRLDS